MKAIVQQRQHPCRRFASGVHGARFARPLSITGPGGLTSLHTTARNALLELHFAAASKFFHPYRMSRDATRCSVSRPKQGQGQRTLNSFDTKDLHQEVIIPAAELAFHGEAFFAGVLLQE